MLLRQANRLMGELKSRLPETDLKPVSAKIPKAGSKKETAKAEEKPKKKSMTELERLESELTVIENKLKSLA